MRIAVVSVLCLVTLLGPQDRAQPKAAEPAEAPPSRSEVLAQGLRGAWQITGFERPGRRVSTGDMSGYALFLDGYMSLELHLRDSTFEPGTELLGLYFQSGTHRWTVDDSLRLTTSVLIGTHNFNDDEEFEFERPGSKRVYGADLRGDILTLQREGEQHRLTLRRIGRLPFPRGERKAEAEPPRDDE